MINIEVEAMCGFTLYFPTNGSSSKTFSWTDGAWELTQDFDAGATFTGDEITEITNIDELAECVAYAAISQGFIVRGALAYKAKTYNRRKDPKFEGDKPSMVDVPRQWVMVDIDNWIIPDRYDLLNEDDHALIIEEVIGELLHENFSDVRMFWQFSASCGLLHSTALKLHLWVWLAAPETNENLRRIFRELMPGVDCAPFNAVQPHYVTAPILIGGHDPLPTRSGWRAGSEDAVVLPTPAPVAYARPTRHADAAQGGTAWLYNSLAQIGDGDGLDGFYGALRPLIWKYGYYVLRGGVQRDDEKLIAVLSAKILSAPRNATRQLNQVEGYANPAWLKQFIEKTIRKQSIKKELSNAKK